jgi:DNA-binding GntR family transcriptional regulator
MRPSRTADKDSKDKASEGSQTMASMLFDAIRADIIRGLLKPGTRLKIQDLAQAYGGGTIPVREALSRLATTGFVDSRDHSGFSVRDVSDAELVDLTRARLMMEPAAMRDAIAHGDIAWEERVLAAHHRMGRLEMYSDAERQEISPTWEAAHDDFHRQLISACTSEWLLRFITELRDQTARYRHISARSQKTRHRDVTGEHRALLDAVLARRADEACRLLCNHFARSTAIALNRGEAAGEPTPWQPDAALPPLDTPRANAASPAATPPAPLSGLAALPAEPATRSVSRSPGTSPPARKKRSRDT